jgi:hypothetical protein
MPKTGELLGTSDEWMPCDECGELAFPDAIVCHSCGDVRERAGWWTDPGDWAITVERAAAWYARHGRDDIAGWLLAYHAAIPVPAPVEP